jgi:hypothetical protein
MIGVFIDGKQKYKAFEQQADNKFSKDIYNTGAENCQKKIDLITDFLKDLKLLEALTEEKS